MKTIRSTHILYIVIDAHGSGGAERMVHQKIGYWLQNTPNRYQFTVLSTNATSQKSVHKLHENVSWIDLKTHTNPIISFFQYFLSLRKSILNSNPDLIIVVENGWKAHFVPLLVSSPIVFESHAIDLVSPVKYKLLMKLVRRSLTLLYNNFNAHVVLHPRMKDFLKNSKSIVIPNPNWIPFKSSKKYESKKVLAVGRLVQLKGYLRMFEIWKKVQVLQPHWELHVFGEGPQKKVLENYIHQNGLENNVFLRGVQSNMKDVYKHYDIFMHTAHHDAFPAVLMEAAAYGLARIAFDCPVGPAAIIRDEIDGLLVKNGDCDMFLSKLLSLMSDPCKCEVLGKEAQNHVFSEYDPKFVMPNWDILFDKILSKNS